MFALIDVRILFFLKMFDIQDVQIQIFIFCYNWL